VVLDVRTGELLAMASVPDYDPNAFIPSISSDKFKSYTSKPQLSPFTNRAITSFTPGSTMKVPTAIAGAMNGMATRSFTCTGFVPYGDHKIGCWIWNKSRGSHGSLTLPRAIQQSCNPYFNKLANAIGWKAMVDGFSLVGIGKKTGIELPNEDPGTLPGSRAWRAAVPGAVMTPALTAMLSIGQGDTMASPLQLAAMLASVANGGKYYQPRIVKKVVAENGNVQVSDFPKLEVDLLASGIKDSDLALIRLGMWKAVNEAGGTAGKVRMTNYEIAAKTGTAQTVDNGKKSNNSWVMSFAPYDQPRYAVVIMAQAAGSGGGVCGPLVNMIYSGIFAQEEGMRLPLKPQSEYAGHLERIEAIEPIKDVLAAIQATEAPVSDPITSTASNDDLGETGNEIGDILPTNTPSTSTTVISPKPTITQEIDREGQVIPRATPIQE
jgi:penicillin-binding protein 2